MTMFSRNCIGILAFALSAVGCDKVPLLAPTDSTVSLTTASSFVPTGGSTEVTAFVAESSGTPVQNGTYVRFTTNLGRVDPIEAQTKNGYAVTTFLAGDSAGVADVRANSGSAGGATSTISNGDGDPSTVTSTSNVVKITIGSAAVESVVLGANPGTVPPGGGTVDLLATVTGLNGRSLQGIPVTFIASAGQLASPTVLTDASGQARTTLTTDRTTTVTATAGAKTSTAVTVTTLASVTVSLSATAATPVPTVGQQWSFTATLSPANDPAAQATQFDWNFGDGATVTTNGNTTTHIYTSGSTNARTVSVTVKLANGQTLVATTEILLGVF